MFVMTSWLCAALGLVAQENDQKQAAVSAVVARQTALQNLEVTYTIDELFSPPAPDPVVEAGSRQRFARLYRSKLALL